MDKELLTTLGLDPEKDLKGLLEDLEGKQYEFFERLETTNDEKRKEELNGLLSRIDETIGQIKNQLASVNSAIIFDAEPSASAPAADKEKKQQKDQQKAQKEQEKAQKQKEKEQGKEKQEQLTAKVQALKDKEEARRKQEAEAKAKAEAEAKAKAEAEAKAKAEAEAKAKQAAAAAAQPPMTDLQQGLVRYQKKDFKAAFPIFKQLAEKNDATAQYMLACMYSRGEGTAADRERAEFWMKKSADNGDKVAQFDYAVFLLSDQGRDDAKTANGIHYLKRSADQGYRDAMERYVELVEKGTGELHELKVARGYCSKLMPLMEDSYDKQKFVESRRALRTRQRDIRRRRFGAASSSAVSTVGALILMCATIILFAGYHRDFLMTLPVFSQLPDMIDSMLFLCHYTVRGDFASVQVDMSGAELTMLMIAVGWMFKGAGYKYTRNTLSTVVVRIGCAVRYLAIIGHIALCSYLEMDPTVYLQDTLIAIVVMIVAGRIVGWILGKILGTKKM